MHKRADLRIFDDDEFHGVFLFALFGPGPKKKTRLPGIGLGGER